MNNLIEKQGEIIFEIVQARHGIMNLEHSCIWENAWLLSRKWTLCFRFRILPLSLLAFVRAVK